MLVIGGGSSHNFGAFFGGAGCRDPCGGRFSVNTRRTGTRRPRSSATPTRVISVNRQFFDTPAYRKALADFAASGKGLVMLHPGAWYGYAMAGAERDHRRRRCARTRPHREILGQRGEAGPPVMKGVPASFDVEDELYYMNAEADKIPPGTAPIEVLANVAERAVQAAAPVGLDHPAPHGAHRRDHAGPRRTRP